MKINNTIDQQECNEQEIKKLYKYIIYLCTKIDIFMVMLLIILYKIETITIHVNHTNS